MKHLYAIACAAAALCISPGAEAAVVSLASDVELSGGAFVVPIGSDATYTFSYSPDGLSTVAIAMTGTGQVFGNGFFSPNAPDPLQIGTLVPDQLSLGMFFSQTGTQQIPFSISQSSVALRFVLGGNTHYGYATVGGSRLIQFAYNDTPDGSIVIGDLPAAAIPEPATWGMMIIGFGAIGGAARRRQSVRVRFA